MCKGYFLLGFMELHLQDSENGRLPVSIKIATVLQTAKTHSQKVLNCTLVHARARLLCSHSDAVAGAAFRGGILL